ncbi:MAG: hypothetical protein Q7K42_02700, partial [Candidatus Diapherotrites archaeon]|nr:hypothetical protein [Candidatus Diapherotrites archaeon]
MVEINLDSLEKEVGENPFISKFEQFLQLKYKKDIERLAGQYPEKKSLNLDFMELERYDFSLADELIVNPDYLLEAVHLAVKRINIPILQAEDFSPYVRFFNLPKDREPLLKDIGALHIGKMISIEGVIRQITDVLPKLKLAVYECRKCGNTYKVKQDTQFVQQPGICSCKSREFELIDEKSVFVDYQKIQIQEPLEKLRGNEQPTTLNIYVS